MSGATSKRILLVEDDRSVRRMLSFSLRAASFEITEAAKGRDALQLLEDEPFEAVVLDLSLPNGLGGEILERLRYYDEFEEKPPVWLVISALDSDDAATRYGDFSIERFLTKPFDPWDMVRKLEELLADQETYCE
jgi:DNA-binding response OmpR family regulator